MHEHHHHHPEGYANEHFPLAIIGTDADARIALDVALAQNIIVYGFMSDNEEYITKELNDVAVVMRIDTPEGKKFLDNEQMHVIVVERDIERRKELFRKTKGRKMELVSLAYPDFIISDYANIGKSNLIGPGCKVMANSQIGSYNSFQGDVFVDTDVTIDSFCTFQSGVKIGRGVTIADEVFVGAGAVIFAGVKLGKGCYVGPGAVVLRDVAEKTKVFGNPAKEV